MNQVPLEPGETITMQYRLHPIALVPYILTAAASAVGAGVSAYLSAVTAYPLSVTFLLLWIVLTIITGVMLLVGWLFYRRSRLLVTSEHVFTLWQSTLFGQEIKSVTLASITNADGKRTGILATIFNYGSVSVQTVGGTIDFLSFGPLRAPEWVASAIDYDHTQYVTAHPGQSV